MAYLQIDHVGISFSRGGVTTEVLRDVNLRIEPGEYVLQIIVTDKLANTKRQIASQFVQFEVTNR